MRLWLDDKRKPPNDSWYWVTNPASFKAVFNLPENILDISMDHDLGVETTGYDLLKWMANEGFRPSGRITIHSMNPVGRANMESFIKRYFT